MCVKLRLQFPYIHDLDRLNVFLEAAGVPIPAEVWEARDLTPFAYERRYPHTGDPVSREEYERLLNIARTVVGWAEEYVQSRT